MIRLNLMAGMGNQMFEYAYARALSLQYHEKLEINPYFMTLAGLGAGRKRYFNNVLSYLNLPEEITFMNKGKGYLCGVPDIAQFVALRKYNNGAKLHGEKQFQQMCKKGKIYTESYFELYRDQIKKELHVRKEPSDKNKEKIEELQQCNAVCVHIRRGDYVSNEKNRALVVCDETYYKRGMEYIAERVENSVFYIFSDNLQEINWIKENYHFDYNVQYIELNNLDYEELRLMYQCKHFIIANSTFSWWGAYLSANEDKVIIAPATWNKDYSGQIDVYTKSMILL